MKIQARDFAGVMHDAPNYTANIIYGMLSQGVKPTQAKVLKEYKTNSRYYGGYEWGLYTPEQKADLEIMVKDTYKGLKEAGEF